MLVFVAGGSHQGKLDWVSRELLGHASVGIAGSERESLTKNGSNAGSVPEKVVVNHFQDVVRQWLDLGEDPEIKTKELIAANAEKCLIIITDEIGGGIIPMDPGERQWREIHGRICCDIAAGADACYHVMYGIGRRIK